MLNFKSTPIQKCPISPYYAGQSNEACENIVHDIGTILIGWLAFGKSDDQRENGKLNIQVEVEVKCAGWNLIRRPVELVNK